MATVAGDLASLSFIQALLALVVVVNVVVWARERGSHLRGPDLASALGFAGAVQVLLWGTGIAWGLLLREPPGFGGILLSTGMGFAMLGSSVALYNNPRHHVAWGIFLTVLAMVSLLPPAYGGMFVGTAFGVAAGIQAILWKPRHPGPAAVSPSAEGRPGRADQPKSSSVR